MFVRMHITARISGLIALGGRDGDEAYVLSILSPWEYVANGGHLAIDHITVEATADGGSTRWLRNDQSSNTFWRTGAAHVYLDSVSGDDENQGIYFDAAPPASPLALRTAAELDRRWGRETVTSELSSSETIVHVKNAVALFPLRFRSGPNSFFRILGENTTTLHAGTLNASGGFIPWVPTAAGGGTASIIQDSGIASWAPYVGKRLFFPRAGSYSIVLKDLGGGSARVAVPQTVDETNFDMQPTLSPFPVGGDAYVVDDPVHVAFSEIDLTTSADPTTSFGPFGQVNVADVTLETNAATTPIFTVKNDYLVPLVFYRCIIEGSFINTPSAEFVIFNLCRARNLSVASVTEMSAGGVGFFGGALIDPGVPTLNIVAGGLGDAGALDYYTAVQGAAVVLLGRVQIRSISVWDAPPVLAANPDGHAILVGMPGHRATTGDAQLVDRGGYPIFGNGGPGVGLFVSILSKAARETLPNVIGANGEFKLAAGGRARFFDETTGLPSPVLAETWANLAAPQPVGFGGSAHDYSDESHLIETV